MALLSYKQYPGQDKKILFTANEVDPELKGLGPNDVSSFWILNEDGYGMFPNTVVE
jgi:hypothetical protein